MQTVQKSASLAETLRTRRRKLANLIEMPVILWSGKRRSRNFPANTYPFRASSHFLYFAGLPLENAAIRLHQGKLQLFMDDASPNDTLWHGETMGRDQAALKMGANSVHPLSELKSWAGGGAATIAAQDAETQMFQSFVLDRAMVPPVYAQGWDWELRRAIVQLRLTHDDAALAEIRQAVVASVAAHQAGMAATPTAKTEAQVRAAMEGAIMSHNATCAYASIVTVQGEVLHNERYHHSLETGDLLLADVGAEAASGWASDVTRTWPVSGKFSASQRALYDVVLAAHDAAIAALRPGVEYRDIHLLAAKTLAAGFIELGILKGNPDDLVAMDAHALFFPHGVGHLLGLDVHDMEDLGDAAGYAEGRGRSDRFGLGYLRLDRPLAAGMVVTIEPGFYQVPALLNDLTRIGRYRDALNWSRLDDFADVRGIRIEDDVLITDTGAEVLTAALPVQAEAIEQLVQSRS